MVTTTINQGHFHLWEARNKFTTVDDGHRHMINFTSRIALPAGVANHTHKLL